MNFKIKFISLIFLSIMITACDFHLRGSINADFDSISIRGGSEALSKNLIKKFKQDGIQTNSPDPEKFLEILSDKIEKRILSLSSSGTVKEYEINYFVSYRYKSKESQWSEQITKEVTRDYTYDDNDRVAKELEEKSLVQGMRDEIIRSIVNQMNVTK